MASDAVVDFNPAGIERHGEGGVVARGKNDVEDLLIVEMFPERRPSRIVERLGFQQLVDRQQQGLFRSGPAIGGAACLDALDLPGAQAGLEPDAVVLCPFVFGIALPAGTQNYQLTLTWRQARF